jgi:hypothetical protein
MAIQPPNRVGCRSRSTLIPVILTLLPWCVGDLVAQETPALHVALNEIA